MSEYIEKSAEVDEEEELEKKEDIIDEEDSEDDSHVPNEYDTSDPFIADDVEEEEEVPPPLKRPRDELLEDTQPSKKPKTTKKRILKKGKERVQHTDEVSEKKQKDDLLDEESEEEEEDNFIVDQPKYSEYDAYEGIEDAREIFGEDDEQIEEVETVGMEEEQITVQDKYDQMRKVFEPAILEMKYLTEEDDKIRETDIPERLQVYHKVRTDTKDEEIQEEAEWIYKHLFKQRVESSSKDQSSENWLSFDDDTNKDNTKQENTTSNDDWNYDWGTTESDQQNKTEEKKEEKTKEDPKKQLKEQYLTAITHVLTFLLKNFYDVPFISQYRKEHIDPLKNDEDLWKIFEWDRKWVQLKEKKEKLQKMYNECQEIDPIYSHLLKECDNIVDVNDMLLHFQLFYGSKKKEQHKRPTRRDKYAMCIKANLKNFAESFGLTPLQYAENMLASYNKNVVVDADKEPQELASNFVCKEFSNEEAVLEATRYMIAYEIAHEPVVRQKVRVAYEMNAQISTIPSKKGNLQAKSEYKNIMNIDKENITKYSESENGYLEFLKIIKAEQEGFLTLKITIPDDIIDQCLDVKTLFLSDKLNSIAQKWNKQRELIMEEVKKLLHTTMEQYLRSIYIREARSIVISKCRAALREKLMTGRVENAPERFKVMGACAGMDDEMTTFVVIDGDGEVLDTLEWKFIATRANYAQQQEQKKYLENFINKYDPRYIAVATTGLQARNLYEDLRKISRDNVFYVSHEVAKIFEVSKIGKEEFQNYTSIKRRAVAIARMLQDPIYEYAKLFNPDNDILCLKLHPLQSMVPSDELLPALEQEMYQAVSKIGVDINRVSLHKHMQPILSFVCGLGPRKARSLIQWINNQPAGLLKRRRTLLQERVIDKNVFTNCAGFIRVRIPATYTSYEEEEEMDILDDTRVHPESYDLAVKMSVDALDVEDGDDEKKHSIYVKKVMEESEKLNDLDLDAYADELEKRKIGKKHITLKDIKKELQGPYIDPREPFREYSAKEIFYLITGESPQTFHENQVINVLVSKVYDRVTYCTLDNGITGILSLKNITEDRNVYKCSQVLEEGQTIECVILEIDYQYFQVKLSCLRQDIERFKEPEIEPQRFKPVPKKKKTLRYRRQIKHPNFLNVTYPEAMERLADKPPGELIIRPSSKGPNHIALTLKFFGDTYINLDIVEENKKDPFSLGEILRIGNDRYEDLDEIIVRHVEPMIQHAKTLIEHPKFVDKTPDEIEQFLKKQKEENPSRIPYCVSLDPNRPGSFIIHYLPNKRVKRQHVGIKPGGYYFLKRIFKNPIKLFNAFKRAYKELTRHDDRRQESYQDSYSW